MRFCSECVGNWLFVWIAGCCFPINCGSFWAECLEKSSNAISVCLGWEALKCGVPLVLCQSKQVDSDKHCPIWAWLKHRAHFCRKDNNVECSIPVVLNLCWVPHKWPTQAGNRPMCLPGSLRGSVDCTGLSTELPIGEFWRRTAGAGGGQANLVENRRVPWF